MAETVGLVEKARREAWNFLGFLSYAAERFATRQTMRVAASLSYTSTRFTTTTTTAKISTATATATCRIIRAILTRNTCGCSPCTS